MMLIHQRAYRWVQSQQQLHPASVFPSLAVTANEVRLTAKPALHAQLGDP
jgi:hypothetical protein